jgi:hypothetical protein
MLASLTLYMPASAASDWQAFSLSLKFFLIRMRQLYVTPTYMSSAAA